MRSLASTCRVVWYNIKISLFLYIFFHVYCILSFLIKLFNAFNVRSSFETTFDKRILNKNICTIDICSKVLSTIAFKVFVTFLKKWSIFTWDWMCWNVVVNKDKRVEKEWNDSKTFENLKMKSRNREIIWTLKSTKETIETINSTTTIASIMLMTWMLTWTLWLSKSKTQKWLMHNHIFDNHKFDSLY